MIANEDSVLFFLHLISHDAEAEDSEGINSSSNADLIGVSALPDRGLANSSDSFSMSVVDLSEELASTFLECKGHRLNVIVTRSTIEVVFHDRKRASTSA